MNSSLASVIRNTLNLTSFTPGRRVNKTMSALVAHVTQASAHDIATISKHDTQALQHISSQTEYELEAYWSRKIARAHNPHRTLAKFPYTRNYALLTNIEIELLKQTGLALNSHNSVLFVGSGPLPLSFLELFRQTGAAVDVLDRSEEAIELSKRFCGALDITPLHIHGKAEKVWLDRQYEAIIIAALAGESNKDKQHIVNHLAGYLHPNGRLVIRSATGARSLLYPEVSTTFPGLARVAEHHPTNEVINSVLIYKKGQYEK